MEQSKFYQIKNVTKHEYTLVGCDGSVITRPIQDVDKSASSFTIEDAREGDVLASGQVVFIFKVIRNGWLYCHCSVHNDGIFIAESYDMMTYKYFGEVHPATKEQRDQLEKAITEAGYAWDADKKELKKIEPKTLNADEVIEWLNHRELSCDDVVTTVIPDDSPTSVPHRVKWLSDEFIKKFKQDFDI